MKKPKPPAKVGPELASGRERTAPAAILDPGKLAGLTRIEPAYRHPESAMTVAYHHEGHAYTITGLPAGKAPEPTLKTHPSDH